MDKMQIATVIALLELNQRQELPVNDSGTMTDREVRQIILDWNCRSGYELEDQCEGPEIYWDYEYKDYNLKETLQKERRLAIKRQAQAKWVSGYKNKKHYKHNKHNFKR